MKSICIAALLAFAATARAQDSSTLARIRDEGMNRSHSLELFDHLTTVIGPRLTASPAFKQSVDWAVKEFRDYGLSNAHLESWPFGRGWTLEGQIAELTAPRYMPLIAYAEAWSPPTNGIVEGKPVYIGDLANADSVRAHASSIRGAIVLATKPQDVFITRDRLQPTEHDQPVPIGQPRPVNATGPLPRQTMFAMLRDLGAAAVLRPTEGNEGTMFVLGNRASTPENSVASLIVSSEQYNLLVRMLRDSVPVKLRVAVRASYQSADTNAYNVIAEIPGTDPKLGGEVVLLGAHIDSWHSAQGAADNADAVAELIEAMRILKATGVRPRRTIRAAIWGGEEQGLLGSKAYAQRHYAGDANAAAREKFYIYLNNDPGTGRIYGWYMQGNAGAKTIFDEWLAPLRDLGARRNVMEKIGSTDHLSFTALGLPGFNTIQDYTEYDTRIHHTNMDTFERVNAEALKQASVVVATFAYDAAMREGAFPRAAATP
ncbi:MAG TPA: M20/M25/M40 family metallo-hydrolase [Gemmatimonadaceae bacterium]